jgi:oxygen-independent coproporphyrinogen-3 oxidase
MAGIYLHIPFCKQACHYCNFHFSTSLRAKSAMTAAIIQEIEWQKDYLQGASLQSIYFGGGTPSLLDVAELQQIIAAIYRFHPVDDDAEITLEANPDDLNIEKLHGLRQDTPINRLSIGIQSFSEKDLQWMHRAHSAAEARNCIDLALQVGFKDLSIDLIYGAPTTSDQDWAQNVAIALGFQVPHLSCYSLTVEDGTALGAWVKKGQQAPMDEEKAARQFEILQLATEKAGYEHYEISNFALPGRYARHNSSYWLGKPYLGLGPAAHSYNGHVRQWNIANNALYLKAIEEHRIPFEQEILTPTQRYNEYIMTTLRTVWGTETAKMEHLGPQYLEHFQHTIVEYIDKGWIEVLPGKFRLSKAGKLLADRIASELFYTDQEDNC